MGMPPEKTTVAGRAVCSANTDCVLRTSSDTVSRYRPVNPMLAYWCHNMKQKTPAVPDNTAPGNAATQVAEVLDRLRAIFPLEARIAAASAMSHAYYREVLQRWGKGEIPQTNPAKQRETAELAQLDALVITPDGIGCYPFSAHDTGIHAAFDNSEVAAMCAIDALAIARVLNRPTRLTAPCHVCGQPLSCAVEASGGLAHDQAGMAHVVWQSRGGGNSCSTSLCRGIYFVCTGCATPHGATRLTLPQATAVGNAFFGFQRRLLSDSPPD